MSHLRCDVLPAERAIGGIELLASLEKAGAVTTTSLQLPPTLPWDQYEALAAMFGQLHRTSAWLIGDLLNFGEKVYGEKYTQAAQLTGLADQTLMNYASVCAHVPRSRRRASLPFSVHAEVAYKEPEEQEMWLRKALTHGWTRSQLRLEIRGEPQVAVIEHETIERPQPLAGEPGSATELLKGLRNLFSDRGVSVWLARAIELGWTMDECLTRIDSLNDGAIL